VEAKPPEPVKQEEKELPFPKTPPVAPSDNSVQTIPYGEVPPASQ
jgi:hypothetical protein